MRTISIPTRALRAPVESKRLLALATDERLVARIRRGSDVAFEVVFERHGPGVLSFCRHMLGVREEAEDAVQHTFAAAYRALRRDERDVTLKPWLYAIARNRSLSMLRARRESVAGEWEVVTDGLAEQVEKRAELRDLLQDLRELPEQPRAALLLAEVGDLAHAEVAAVMGCEVQRVKALIFQARSGLIQRREARETPCEAIREQLATLRGGSLRRSELRHHVAHCPGCASFREQVRRQRGMLAAALPVLPSVSLKSSVLASAGIGGGSAAGGGAAGLAGATLTKLAVAGALAGGGAVTGTAIVDRADRAPAPVAPAAERAAKAGPRSPVAAVVPVAVAVGEGRRRIASDERPHSNGAPRSRPASARRRLGRAVQGAASPRRSAKEEAHGSGSKPPAQRGRAVTRADSRPAPQPRGRGPVERPARSSPPRRGPPSTVPASPKAAAPTPAAKQPPAQPPEAPPAVEPHAGKPAAPPGSSSRAPAHP